MSLKRCFLDKCDLSDKLEALGSFVQLCEPILHRLGLYQVARMREINIDKWLLADLIEPWRPEMHTFHLPVGEMTVTL